MIAPRDDAPDLIRVEVTDQVAVTDAARVGIRSYYSTHFLAAAEDAAEAAQSVEESRLGEQPQFSLKHRGFVLAAVIQATVFMEAAINEVLQDAADDHLTEKLFDVGEVTRANWAALWIALRNGETGRILDRYQSALIAARCEPFDEGSEPWQSAKVLVQLRNHLIHYKPATVYNNGPETIVGRLHGKIQPNPLSRNTGQVDGWLSADCARWAVKSARALVTAFADHTGARPNFMLALDDLRRRNP